ncbi:MAG TPA: hypothetical protein VD862_00565 [Candidatus Paceibacterota bacterium]|nr:hypothetical protein [Candidatus Paceibacterota bacterium]
MTSGGKAPLRAIVQGTYGPSGGRYAVGTATTVTGSITFSLKRDVWGEGREPRAGEEVFLDDITRNREGWRANRARLIRLGDGQG